MFFANWLAVKNEEQFEMKKQKALGANRTWPTWPCNLTFSVLVILLSLGNGNTSDFLNSRKAKILVTWKKEMKTPYPSYEVLLATQYFIRDVLAENQQFVMTTDGSYWNALRTKYGGKQTSLKNNSLKFLYDFNWYIFEDLKKYHEPKPDKLRQFFKDYLDIVDLFCNRIPDSTKITKFFETYYSDWLIAATYNRDFLPRLKPVLKKAISDLPVTIQQISATMDSLEDILKELDKNRAKIDFIIKSANYGFLKGYDCFLIFNFFSGKQVAGLINAFWVIRDFQYPVKIGSDIVEMNVLKLRCIDNLSLSIAAPGYYYRKQVFIFPENQPYAWRDFAEFFHGNKAFPFLDLFVCDTTIQSYFDHGMVSKSVYNELMAYYSWFKTFEGNKFVKAIDSLCKPTSKYSYEDWSENLDKSLLLHEVVGHGGTFYNSVIKEPEIPTFEYHVEAEFYAHEFKGSILPVCSLIWRIPFPSQINMVRHFCKSALNS
jgi:hypothetical protein